MIRARMSNAEDPISFQRLMIMPDWKNRDEWMGYATIAFIIAVIIAMYLFLIFIKGGVISS